MGVRFANFISTLKQISDIPGAYIDCALYLAITLFGALSEILDSEDAKGYIPTSYLFWSKSFCAVAWKVALALKLFRSTAFADHKLEVKENTETKETKP